MAKTVLNDVDIYYGGRDISGDSNELSLDAEAEPVEVTNFNSDLWKECIGGIQSASAMFKGFQRKDTAEVGNEFPLDEAFFSQDVTQANDPANMDASGVPVSVGFPATDGGVSYGMRVLRTKYTQGLVVGDAYTYDLDLKCQTPFVRGQFLAVETGATATQDGTGRQLGAITLDNNMQMVINLHVLKLDGTTPTLDIIIESDATDSWSGSETTQATFTQVTEVGVYQTIVVNPSVAITDTWWRYGATISASGGEDFDFVISAGISLA